MVYANFWKRLLALILDTFFIWLCCMVLIIPWYVTPLGIIIAAFYHVVFETSPLRATPGKALLKMAVVKPDGSTITVKDSIIRFAVSFLSTALVCLGYLVALFTEKKQTFHDFVANTVVIEGQFAENNFWQIFLSQSKAIFANDHFAASAPSGSGPISSQSLEELYNLHQKGILTDEEYKMKKEEYLRRL